jgi:hypothetical protein
MAVVLAARGAYAQTPPAVRQLDRLERISSVPLASVAAALPVGDGRILVNDMTSHRVLLLDSTLSHSTVVADTTSATSHAYGSQPGTLIRYRGDSALYIDPGSLSMLVITPAGAIARVLALPLSGRDQSQAFTANLYPAFDAGGRLLVRVGGGGGYPIGGVLGESRMSGPVDHTFDHPDSSLLVRIDLASRAIDTVARYKTVVAKVFVKGDAEGFRTSMVVTGEPLPLVDDWTVLGDGTIAIVRGRDYHVDWRGADGRWTSTPKMPFDWRRLDDDRKNALIDSSFSAEQAKFARADSIAKARLAAGGAGAGAASGIAGAASGGRGGGAGTSSGARRPLVPSVAGRAELRDVPDYFPPFKPPLRGAGVVRADADGNLWIRTTTLVNGQAVFDVVNRRGELFDRVQLPAFRTIAGFGPGVVYLAVQDRAGVVRLERTRIH